MEKYIVNQDYSCIRTAESCTPISLEGRCIKAVDRVAVNEAYTEADNTETYSIINKEDAATVGLKKHVVELGAYYDEQQAREVFLALVDWLNDPKGKPVFVFPECDGETCVPWA